MKISCFHLAALIMAALTTAVTAISIQIDDNPESPAKPDGGAKPDGKWNLVSVEKTVTKSKKTKKVEHTEEEDYKKKVRLANLKRYKFKEGKRRCRQMDKKLLRRAEKCHFEHQR